MDTISYSEFCQYVKVSRETYQKLLIYHELLVLWQNKMNLVSKLSLKNAFHRHFIDSAQIFDYCCRSKGNILDFGSGAGFPGLVLAIMGLKNIQLIESSKKKCLFMNEVLLRTETKSIVHNCRIEHLPYLNPSFIISRALAPTQKLLNLCLNYMMKGNKDISEKDALKKLPNLLFLKGKNYKNELSALTKEIKVNFLIINSITNKDGKILFYKNKRRQN